MSQVRFSPVNGGASGTTSEKPKSNPGEVGEGVGKGLLTATEPHIRTRKPAEDGPEVQALEKLAQYLLANPDNRHRVLEFAKDGSVPSSERYLVITVQRQKQPPVDLFLVQAKSHPEAEAAAVAASEAKGLDPMGCFSARLTLALISV